MSDVVKFASPIGVIGALADFLLLEAYFVRSINHKIG